MHKSQGQTMDKAVVNLGKSESTAGLTFVCLSRAKRLVDLLIEPMPLERLSKIGDTLTFQLRLREEVRLRALAGDSTPRVMSVQIYISFVRRRVERQQHITSTPVLS